MLAEWTEKHAVRWAFNKPGKPTQNAFIKRFNRKAFIEIANFNLLWILHKLREMTKRWLSEEPVLIV